MQSIIAEYIKFNKNRPFTCCIPLLELSDKFNNSAQMSLQLGNFVSEKIRTSNLFEDDKAQLINFLNKYEVFLLRNYGVVDLKSMLQTKKIAS